jgi:predicted amidohydrolase YtcJ
MRIKLALVALCGSLLILTSCQKQEPEELLIYNAKIWSHQFNGFNTWITISDGLITSFGSSIKDVPLTMDSIDMQGKLLLPGFNDSHVHFESAGSLLLGINLLDVHSDDLFRKRIKNTTNRIPDGSWITKGDWGAYESYRLKSDGNDSIVQDSYTPHRTIIDDITPAHPVLVTKFDQSQGLVNQRALEILKIKSESGLLVGDQLRDALKMIPPKSFKHRLAEIKRGLDECLKMGVTSVQDMSSWEALELYNYLQEKNELTCRIQFCPSKLPDYTKLVDSGWTMQYTPDGVYPPNKGIITFGTIKTHIDGIMGNRTARFFGPYLSNNPKNPNWRGSWREFSRNYENFQKLAVEADASNVQLRVHAIGDEANSMVIDLMDTLTRYNGEKERRFRLVHAQVINPKDFERFQNRDFVAEVQPYHVTDDMRWMERRIGKERCEGAYAFKTLAEKGAILSFGSDWPGTNASYYPLNPILGVYAAVTRQTMDGKPEGGWFPEQRVTLQEALKAYTYGSAYGSFEENSKGSIAIGQVADLVVLNKDLFETQPSEWKDIEVEMTFLNGNLIYEK